MTKRRFTIDDLLGLQRPACRVPMHLSPDGRWLAISVQKQLGVTEKVEDDDPFTAQGVPDDALGCRVLIVETTSGVVQEPFPAGSTSWSGQWSPDGKWLIAYVQDHGYVCLGLWNLERRTMTMLREAEAHPVFGFEIPRWTPDSGSVVVKLRIIDAAQSQSTRRKIGGGAESISIRSFDPSTPEDANERIGEGLAGTRGDLGVVDIGTGAARRLTTGYHFRGWRISPDGRSIAMLRFVETNILGREPHCDLTVIPLDGSPARTVATRLPNWWGTNFSWSPDSRNLAYITVEADKSNQLFVVPADGSREPLRLSDDAGVQSAEYDGPRWSPHGDLVYSLYHAFVGEYAADGSRARVIDATPETGTPGSQEKAYLVRILQRPAISTLSTLAGGSIPCLSRDATTLKHSLAALDLATGRAKLLLEGERIDPDEDFGYEASADGSACYLIREACDRAPEVWKVCLDGHGNIVTSRRLLSLNDFDKVAHCSTRIIEWRTADGQIARGILALPADYKEGESLPLILSIYGGFHPSRGYAHRFGVEDMHCANAHWLTGNGYAVLYPDMPMTGSDPMRQIPGLVLPAMNRVVEMGIANTERIGVMGFSYGGYCVLSLLVQTTRFRAAISMAGAGFNMTSNYALASGWCEGDQARLNGTPWNKRENYIENSPWFYMDRAHTPLLLMAGSDNTDNARQAEEVYTALRRLGQKVELRIYNGQGHFISCWTEHNIRDVCGRVLSWFDGLLKPDQYRIGE